MHEKAPCQSDQKEKHPGTDEIQQVIRAESPDRPAPVFGRLVVGPDILAGFVGHIKTQTTAQQKNAGRQTKSLDRKFIHFLALQGLSLHAGCSTPARRIILKTPSSSLKCRSIPAFRIPILSALFPAFLQSRSCDGRSGTGLYRPIIIREFLHNLASGVSVKTKILP